MAELQMEDGELTLHLSAAEKLEGVHGDLHVPLAAVRGVEILDHPHQAAMMLGFKIGTRIPGLIEVGSVRGTQRRIFAAVHHGTPRGLRIRLSGTAYDEWIVGCADPEATIAALGLPLQK